MENNINTPNTNVPEQTPAPLSPQEIVPPAAPEKTIEEFRAEAIAAREQRDSVYRAVESLRAGRAGGIVMKLSEVATTTPEEPEEERRPPVEYRYDPQSGTSVRTDSRGNPMSGGNTALRSRY